MGLRFRRAGLVAVALGIAAAGCRHTPRPATSDLEHVAPDTLRGVIALTGNMPRPQVILRWGTGPADAAALSGPEAATLQGLTGLEVMVRGRWGPSVPDASPVGLRAFGVEQFLVRAGDGFPAHDGVVAFRDGQWGLVSASGTHTPVPFLPQALRHQPGVRAYVLGSLAEPPRGYGIVHPR